MLPQQILTTAIVLAAVLATSIIAYSSGNNMLLFAMVAFPPVIFLINNPERTFWACVALSASSLTLPGLPSRLNLHLLLMVFCSVTFLASSIVQHRKLLNNPHTPYILIFAGLLVMHMYVRGFGLRSLGGESWGGFSYITMLMSCFFFLSTGHILLTAQKWRRMLIVLCTLSILPTLAQAIYAFSGGAIHHVFYFIVPEFQVLEFMFQREAGSQLARLHQANITSQYFFILAFLIYDRRQNRPLSIALVVLSLIFAGLAGNRISMVFNLIFALFFLVTERSKSIGQIVFHPAVLFGFIGLILLGLFAPFLPQTFQRVISFLPFSNVSWEVKMAASSTISWRFEVWAAALQQLPQYLFVGKGFAFSAEDIMTINARVLNMNDIDFVIASRNYHNGFIHTLIDLGILSLLCALGFMFSVSRRHFKMLNREWVNPQMQHLHRIVFSVFLATCLVYFFIAGSVTHLATIFFWTIILEGILRADVKLKTTPKPTHSISSDAQQLRATDVTGARPSPSFVRRPAPRYS